jgi:hypothetical protein
MTALHPHEPPAHSDAELEAALLLIGAWIDAVRREHDLLRRSLDRAEAMFAANDGDERGA